MGNQSDWDNSDNFWFNRASSAWTISWWMKANEMSTNNNYYYADHIFSTGGTSTWTGHHLWIRGTTAQLSFLNNGSYGAQNHYDASDWDDGEFHHYVVTWDSSGASTTDWSNLKLYRDGSLVTPSGTWSNGTGGNDWFVDTVDSAISGEFRFGFPDYSYGYHTGQIMSLDEIAIWKKALPATGDNSIATIYNSGSPIDVSGIESSELKRYYKFDNGDGTDTAGNHTATIGSALTFSSHSTTNSMYVKNKTANTFDPKSGESTSLLLSLDGFEDVADAWVNYPAASLLDGNWHNLQLTWDGSGAGTKTYDTNLKVFVDGAQLTKNASKGGSSTFTAADKHFKYTEGTFIPGTFGASGWKETGATTDYINAFQGALDNLSLHSEVTDLTKAKEFYGKDSTYEGKPHNYQLSTSLTYANVEGWWTFEDAADNLTTVQDKTSNNIDLTLNNFVSGGNGYVTMTNSDSIYVNNLIKGEGLTLSMTKNLKDDGTWVDSQDQTARLIMSFNGIERSAEYWVAYNTNQTGLSPAVNLLDGLWHSVTLSYQGLGNATEGYTNYTYDLPNDEIRFGPTQMGGVDQPFHFQLAYDGQVLEGIKGGKGYDLAKGSATGTDANAGFVLQNKHLRHDNSAATYVPTTYLASGIIEVAGQDSIHAFQGGFDESSFHSDSWWDDAKDYNQEKPLTIYGKSSALSNSVRRAPYNLRAPSDIEVAAGTHANQYIDPNPYNASSNANGGMEVYY